MLFLIYLEVINRSIVLFLPAESREGGPSKRGIKDLENPFLCGFGRSRPEVVSQDPGDNYHIGDERQGTTDTRDMEIRPKSHGNH